MFRPIVTTLIAIGVATLLAMPVLASEQRASADETTELKAKTESTLQSLQGYSARKRDQAVAEAQELIGELDARIERFESRLDEEWGEMSEATRDNTQSALASLEQKRATLASAYGKLKESSASAWAKMKQGFIENYRSVRESFATAEEKR